MRNEVCALLAAESNAGTRDGWLDTPILGRLVPDGLPEEPQAAAVGEIGPYRIIRCIGEGGMGVVYEAEQRSPQRRVALKLVRPGARSTHIVRRFQHESEILGRLEHPGIARIYEAGIAPVEFSDGSRVMSPFFAMEFVDGRPLTEVAAGLSIDERLELLAKVCDAVEYAHRKGVIHRDLKPANILVREEGIKGSRDQGIENEKPGSLDPFIPKILDFGVARVTGEDGAGSIKNSVQTQVSSLVGTLAYMSPEQLSGDASRVDTRSDVYALGACLYELLAGRPAAHVAGKALSEAVRLIAEQEPVRLGTIDHRLRGEIETIVRKAMEKSPDNRYASAAALAQDIRAHLRHDAITAYPPSGFYQLRKFARRNRTLVIVGSLGVGALAVGAALATTGLLEARHQRDQARRDRDRTLVSLGSERAATHLLSRVMMDDGGINADSPTTLRAIVDRAAADEIEFENRPVLRADLDEHLAEIYSKFGDLPRTIELLERGSEIRDRFLGPNHPKTLLMRAKLVIHRAIAEQTTVDDATARLRELYASILASPDATQEDIGNFERLLGDHFDSAKNYPESEEMFTRSIDRLSGPDVEDDLACATVRIKFAKALGFRKEFSRIEPVLLPALEDLRKHPEAHYFDQIVCRFLLAATYTNLRRLDEAEKFCDETIELHAKYKQPEDDPKRVQYQKLRDYIRTLNNERAKAPAPTTAPGGDAAHK